MGKRRKVVSIENLPKKTNRNEKPRFKSNRTFSSLTLKPSDTSNMTKKS